MWEFSSEVWLFVFLNFSTLCECMFYLIFFLIWGMCLVYVSVVYKVKHCIYLTLQFLRETLVIIDHIIWVQFELSAHIRFTLKIVYLFTLKLIVCNYLLTHNIISISEIINWINILIKDEHNTLLSLFRFKFISLP